MVGCRTLKWVSSKTKKKQDHKSEHVRKETNCKAKILELFCSKGLFQRNYLPCLASRNLWLEKLLVVLVECVIRVWSCSCCRRRYFCMATQRSCFLCQFGPPPSAMMITPLERGDASQKAAQTPFSVRLVSTVGKNFDFFS